VTELAREGAFGGGLVQAAGFEDEAQFVQRRGHGEIPYAREGQGHVLLLPAARRRGPPVEQRLAVAADEDEGGMSPGDDRHGPVAGGFGLRLDIEFFIDVLFQADRDAPPVDHAATAFDGFGRHVAQHLQLIFRTPHQRPEGYGDRQSDHPRTGDSDTHGVLEDIGAQAHRDFFGFPAQRFGGTGRAQCHGDRFGAPDGGDHLPVDEVYDLVAFGLR
jgi:hypothetical protein